MSFPLCVACLWIHELYIEITNFALKEENLLSFPNLQGKSYHEFDWVCRNFLGKERVWEIRIHLSISDYFKCDIFHVSS